MPLLGFQWEKYHIHYKTTISSGEFKILPRRDIIGIITKYHVILRIVFSSQISEGIASFQSFITFINITTKQAIVFFFFFN